MLDTDDSPTFVLFMNVFNTITHLLLGGVTFICCVFAYNVTASDHFRQHIMLCTIGYILLMSEAILSFNRHNGWSLSLKHREKKTSHLIVQVAGSGLAIAGSIIRIRGYGGNTFSTPHGITGWLAFILTFISLLGGLINLWLKNKGKFIKICHALIGCSTLIIAAICLCCGLDKPAFRSWSSDSTANTVIAFTVISVAGTLSSACPGIFKRIFN